MHLSILSAIPLKCSSLFLAFPLGIYFLYKLNLHCGENKFSSPSGLVLKSKRIWLYSADTKRSSQRERCVKQPICWIQSTGLLASNFYQFLLANQFLPWQNPLWHCQSQDIKPEKGQDFTTAIPNRVGDRRTVSSFLAPQSSKQKRRYGSS